MAFVEKFAIFLGKGLQLATILGYRALTHVFLDVGKPRPLLTSP